MQKGKVFLARAGGNQRERICKKMQFHLNTGSADGVKIRHGLGGNAAAPRRAPLRNKRRTRAAQEEHKSNTREHLPISWLALGFALPLTSHCPSDPIPFLPHVPPGR
jgi:hypothetical protein